MPKRRRLRVLVIEDDREWRDALAVMYCRVLRNTARSGSAGVPECLNCSRASECLGKRPTGQTLEDNLHLDIVRLESGDEGIRQLRQQKNPFNIVSLDLNLGPHEKETGLRVCRWIWRKQYPAAIVMITAAAHDVELHRLLGETQVLNLTSMLQRDFPKSSRYFPKLAIEEGRDKTTAIRRQARAIGTSLTYADLKSMVGKRERDIKEEKQFTEADYCVLYVLPDEVVVGCPKFIDLQPDQWHWLSKIVLFEYLALEREQDIDPETVDKILANLDAMGCKAHFMCVEKQGSKKGPRERVLFELEGKRKELFCELAKRRSLGGYAETVNREVDKVQSRKTMVSKIRHNVLKECVAGGDLLIERCKKWEIYRFAAPLYIVLCKQSTFDDLDRSS